nr:RDD family protein [uncultured Carboxylicivirga sp.]
MKIGKTANFYPRLFAFGIDLIIAIGISLFPRIGWIFGLIYFLFKDAMPFTKGQSYGRRLFKIKLVKNPHDESVEKYPEKALIRNIIFLIPILNLYEILLFLFAEQRLGEKWSETKVISTVDQEP